MRGKCPPEIPPAWHKTLYFPPNTWLCTYTCTLFRNLNHSNDFENSNQTNWLYQFIMWFQFLMTPHWIIHMHLSHSKWTAWCLHIRRFVKASVFFFSGFFRGGEEYYTEQCEDELIATSNILIWKVDFKTTSCQLCFLLNRNGTHLDCCIAAISYTQSVSQFEILNIYTRCHI